MRLILFFSAFAALLPAQTLSIYSGNGQIVQEQFLSTAPLVVVALDTAGRPVAGVPVAWSLSQGMGTLVGTTSATDVHGLAQTTFLATSVPPGMSYMPATVLATTGASAANFVVTTSISRQSNGGLAAPPLVELLTPPPTNRAVTGNAGTVVAGAVVVRVTAQSGFQAGTPIANIGLRILPNPDPTQPSAACNAPTGTVLTNAQGIASCDLILGNKTGNTSAVARVGEIQDTPQFILQVTPGPVCTYAVSPLSQNFDAGANTGTLNIAAGTGCTWTAAASDPWLVPQQVSGTGSGPLTYTVASNAGPARSGTLMVAGQTVTITQLATAGPQPLTIATGPVLPVATLGAGYSTLLRGAGGSGQYTWTYNGAAPAGLVFSSSGTVSGTPAAAGSFPFGATVRDAVSGASVATNFTLTVLAQSPGLAITTNAFPAGVIGQAYTQVLTSSSGCSTPFSPIPVFRLVSGSLPAGLVLQQTAQTFLILGTPTTAGTFAFSLTVTDACGATAGASFSMTVGTVQGASMTVSPASLQFASQLGGGAPAPNQTLSISSATPVAFTAGVSTASGGNWLSVQPVSGTIPGSGTTPGSLIITVNPAQLPQGTYTGAVTLTSSAANSPVVIPVTLTIAAAATLSASPGNLTVTLPNAGTTVAQQAIILNTAGTPLGFTANAITTTSIPWLSVNPAAGVTPATLTATLNAVGLPAGIYSGSITVSSAAGIVGVPVTLTVTGSASLAASPLSLSFTYSTGGVTSPQSLAVSSNVPVAFTVSASTTAGGRWLTVSAASGTSPTTLTISVDPGTLAASTYSGLISVQPLDPQIPPVNIPVTFSVAPGPPTLLAITNAASFVPGPVAPGELITLFGSRMGPDVLAMATLDSTGKLNTALAQTRVLFDEIPAALIYAAAGQVSAIVPFALSGRVTTVVQVEYRGVRSSPLTLRVVDASPAIFMLDNASQGAILNGDGSVNGSQNGAVPGSIISIYATGGGQTDPGGVDGQIVTGPVLPRPLLPVRVTIGGQDAELFYAGAAPGLASGVLQINVRIPMGMPRGLPAAVIVFVGGANSPTAMVSIQK